MPYHEFLGIIVAWQKTINDSIVQAFEALEAQPSLDIYVTIVLSAFVYGLVHALGPGHGKMVIASYFLVHGSKMRDALKAAFLTSLVHTLSALSVTLVLYLFFEQTIMHHFTLINTYMYKLSGALIIVIACLLWFEIRKIHREECPDTQPSSLLKIVFSVGIVPCPGVMSIVLFAMILGYYALGIASAMSMSLGMGITMSLAAIASTRFKQTVAHNRYETLFQVLSYAGVGLLLCLGIALVI